MPKNDMPSGAMVLLVLRVLRSGPLHGYAIAQRIHTLSSDALRVDSGRSSCAPEDSVKGWVTAAWGTSETGRKVRFYKITREGVKQLEAEASQFDRLTKAIQAILRTA